MKKLLILWTALCILTACSNRKTIDVDSITQQWNADMQVEIVDKASIEAKYGIDLATASTFIMATSKEFDKSDMYVLALPNKNQKQVLQEQLDLLIEKYKNQWSMGYFQEEEHKVNRMLHKEYGDYIIYIVSDQQEKLYEKLK